MGLNASLGGYEAGKEVVYAVGVIWGEVKRIVMQLMHSSMS